MGDVNLGTVKAKLEADASGVETGVRKATVALNGFSADAIKAGAALGIGFEGATKAIESVANAVASVGRFMVSAVKDTAAYAEQINKMATVTGLSVDMLQSLGKAAEETGTSSESLVRAVARMEVAIANDSKAIASLGLSLSDLKASTPEDALRKVSDRLLSMTDIAERNAAAQKLLGRAYMDVLPALQQYAKESERYVNLTTEQIAASEDVDAALDELGTAWDDLKKQIGAALSTPEVREAIRALAESVREIALAVRGGEGDVAGFFKAIAEGAVNAAKWVVFLRGAIDGMKERMASASKDTPGALTRGLEALDAFEKKLEAGKNKAWGREMFPSMFETSKGAPLGGGADTKAAEDAAKKLQAEIDKLSGKKAQEEINSITAAVNRLGLDGVKDVDALGKRLVKLGDDGGKIPDKLKGTWADAFITEASKVGNQGTSLNKQIDSIYKNNTRIIKDAVDEQEKIEKQHADNLELLYRSQGDILEEQYNLGIISTGQYYDELGRMQQEHYREMAAQARAAAATEKDPAVREALLAQARAYDDIAKAAGRAAEEAKRFAQVGKIAADFGQILGGVANLFDAIGISADSAIGKIVGGLQTAAASIENFSQQTTKAGKIASGLSAVASIYKTGQEKGAGAGALSGAATGAGIGFMVGGPVGAAIGGVAGAVTGIIGGLRKPEYKKIMADVGKSWGVNISEGLAKEIEAIAKTNKISRTLAEVLSVSKIMGESGKDPREFAGKINDLMNAIKSGAVPAAQGLGELGKAFDMVAEAAIAAGTVGDKTLVALLKRAREMGQVTPEMKAFVGQQLESAVAGISKYVKALETLGKASKEGGEAQARFAEIGKTSGVVFNAMFQALVSEKGITAAVDAMKSDYESLHQTLMDTLGPEAVGAILGPVGGAFATLGDETLRPIFEGIDGISQAMQGLANAGYLSTEQFTAMQDATAQLFDEAIAGGADTRTALLAVAPSIQAAISAAEQFGVPLDADMARLKAMAEQNGITFATDPQAAMLDVLVSIAEVLGADVPESARRAAAAMGELAASVPQDMDVNLNVNRNYYDNYGGGGGGGGGEGVGVPEVPVGGGEAPEVPPNWGQWEGFQEGGVINASPTGTPAMLHGREAIIPLDRPSAIGAAMGGGGAAVTFNATFNVDPLQSNAARDDLAQFVINEFIRQAKASPMIRQLLRQDGGR